MPMKRKGKAGVEFDSRARALRRAGTVRPAAARPAAATTDVVAHDTYRTSTGTTVRHAQQYSRGLRIFRSARRFKSERGELATTVAGPVFNVPADADAPTPVDPVMALGAAVAYLQAKRAVPRRLTVRVTGQIGFSEILERPTVLLTARGFAEPPRLHLEWFPTASDDARLAWVCALAMANGGRFEVVVSADRPKPRVLFATSTRSCAGTFQGRWVRFPGDAASSDSFPIPPVATLDGLPGQPSAWTSEPGKATGPNVSCRVGLSRRPRSLGAVEVDNTFVWCNVVHDFFAAFGFDDATGAFEANDPLIVETYADRLRLGGEFVNNVNGYSPRMLLYASPYQGGKAAAVDPGILVHEYAHGVTSRLLGGSILTYPFAGYEAKGLSEGFSDYFALTLLSHVDGTRQLRVFGGVFRPGGMRSYVDVPEQWTRGERDPYVLGRVWCAALLEARAAILALGAGPRDADVFVWQSILDSLKLMAPICQLTWNLTFAHARDGLRTAATALEGSGLGASGWTAAMDGAIAARGI